MKDLQILFMTTALFICCTILLITKSFKHEHFYLLANEVSINVLDNRVIFDNSYYDTYENVIDSEH